MLRHTAVESVHLIKYFGGYPKSSVNQYYISVAPRFCTMIDDVIWTRLEFGKPFTFDVRAIMRPRNDPFRPKSEFKIVPSYHGNSNQYVKLARAKLYCLQDNCMQLYFLFSTNFSSQH